MTKLEELIDKLVNAERQCAISAKYNIPLNIMAENRKAAISDLIAEFSRIEAERGEYKAVIVSMWPTVCAALAYSEHGKNSELFQVKLSAQTLQSKHNFSWDALWRALEIINEYPPQAPQP